MLYRLAQVIDKESTKFDTTKISDIAAKFDSKEYIDIPDYAIDDLITATKPLHDFSEPSVINVNLTTYHQHGSTNIAGSKDVQVQSETSKDK